MEIKIQRQNPNEIIDAYKARWSLFFRTKIKSCALYAFGGVIFMIIGSSNAGTGFWNPMTSFGFSFLLLSLIHFGQLFRVRHEQLKKIHSLTMEISKSSSEGIKLSFTKNSVVYEDPQLHTEMRWTHFTSYKVHKDYLFILSDDIFLFGVYVNKKELPADIYSELVNFVSGRLPEKK